MTAPAGLPAAVDDCVAGILAGDRALVAKAITLVESTRPDHAAVAQELLLELLPHAGRSRRVGISGIPGAGKSTCIDRLGTTLTAAGHKVAVLAVDPSSSRRGGSILGDKTRMASLAVDPRAFIRPSPSGGWLGGVTRSTREAIVVVEAAGYDVVIVETVGTGQSEAAVADMVDCFVLLTVPGTGDSLQGIKRGVLELADVVVVNKADGDRADEAARVARELGDALHLFDAASPAWTPQVLLCSGLEGTGIDELWETVVRHQEALAGAGLLEERRNEQQRGWMWAMVKDRLLDRLRTDPAVRALGAELERELLRRTITPTQGARRLLDALGVPLSPSGDR
ncbi:MAG TPA: methylmalonyl Co-A mutase-associated GTPase MeaB [Acidimicrobiales bacterium]|nr:methylmalonyl Co-A mutase-associated GTPase MeaB [Acidimicrobiales bacterium]